MCKCNEYGSGVFGMKVTVAVLSKNGKSVAGRVLDVLKSFDLGAPLYFGLVAPKKSIFDKSVALLSKQSGDWPTLSGFAITQSKEASVYDFLQLDDSSLFFEGSVYSPVSKSEVAEKLLNQPQHCETLLQTLIQQTDGDYSFLILKEGRIIAGRDPIGVQPFYYGENEEIVAFSTRRKALWELGIEKALSFPPGNLGVAQKEGIKFKPVRTLTYTAPQCLSIDEASIKLQILLEESIKRRVRELKKVAVAFSGGLDSGVVSFLANKLGAKVNLIHVSMENQPETEEAIAAADALKLPLQIDLFKESDVEKTLPKIVELIEEPDPIKASIGVPFYWTAEKASEAGFKVVLAGQGADELFGGYQRYVSEYCREGKLNVQKTMFNDVRNIYESNLERDLKIMATFDVELRLPFAMYTLAEFAMSLPLMCKMEQKSNTLRKLVLRKVALNIGLPKMIADKPKKAVQYSTGINDAVKRIAKKNQKTVKDFMLELFQQSRNKLRS